MHAYTTTNTTHTHTHTGLSIYSSAVRRALETAAPLAKKIGAPVTVMPDLYEVGGIYCNPHADHMRHEPAAGMTSQEIVTAFPFMNVSNLPATGPWNQMKPFDDGAADARRAVSVAAWLLSPEFIEQHRKKSVLIVTHSEFMDLLTKALMNPLLFAVESGNFTHTRDLARLGHAFQNTSLTHFAISPSKQPQQRPHVRMLYLNRVDHLPQTLGGLIDNGRAKL